MQTLEQATEFAKKAHADQFDQRGQPYIAHVLNVAARLVAADEKIVAVLHDVLEDTPTTSQDLRKAGFDERVIAAIETISRRAVEPYADFVIRIRQNELATAVKRADLRENFNLPRTLLRSERLTDDLRRLGRYALSDQFLRGDLNEMDYRQAMKRLEAIG